MNSNRVLIILILCIIEIIASLTVGSVNNIGLNRENDLMFQAACVVAASTLVLAVFASDITLKQDSDSINGKKIVTALLMVCLSGINVLVTNLPNGGVLAGIALFLVCNGLLLYFVTIIYD